MFLLTFEHIFCNRVSVRTKVPARGQQYTRDTCMLHARRSDLDKNSETTTILAICLCLALLVVLCVALRSVVRLCFVLLVLCCLWAVAISFIDHLAISKYVTCLWGYIPRELFIKVTFVCFCGAATNDGQSSPALWCEMRAWFVNGPVLIKQHTSTPKWP